MQQPTQVLDRRQVSQKLERMAREIYEHNFDETEVIMVGIADRGYLLAERIAQILQKISPLHVKLVKLHLDKDDPGGNEMELNLS